MNVLKSIPILSQVVAAAFGSATAGPTRVPNLLLSSCRDSTGYAGGMIARLKKIATTTDSAEAANRVKILLSATTADSVQLVKDSVLCNRAAWSLRRSRYGVDTGTLETFHLVRYGLLRYVGYTGAGSVDPAEKSYAYWYIFDSSFAPLLAVTF